MLMLPPVARAVNRDADATGGTSISSNPTVVSFRRVERRSIHPLMKKLGINFYETKSLNLVGISHGKRRILGQCVLNGESVRWDIWIPHIGTAIDLTKKPREEVSAKYGWAIEKMILYIAAFDREEWTDEDICELIEQRRLHCSQLSPDAA